MTWGITAVAGATIVSGYMSNKSQKDAANKAASAQRDASQASISEEQRQFDAIKELLAPYVNAGNASLGKQQDLLGLNGNGAQQGAIDGIANSPLFGELFKQGESGILQNASATGGLRGGNVQAALAQFRPALLQQLIDMQYTNLGGITALGQNAAAGQGNAGMQTGQLIAAQLNRAGAATAGAEIAAGKANANMWNTVGSVPGMMYGMGFKGF